MLLDVFEALLFVVRNARFEEDRVGSELRLQQRQVAVHTSEEIHAAMSLPEVLLILRESHRTSGTPKRVA